MLKKGIFVSVCLWGVFSAWGEKTVNVDTNISSVFPFEYSRELSINKLPYQQIINKKQATFKYAEYSITPLATFQVEAMVLGSKHYRLGKEAELSPVDLALGWGPMSKPGIIDKFSIRQSNRFYFWKTDAYPIPRQEIITNSANMHMIPATPEIDQKLKSVVAGQQIRFKGYLLKVDDGAGWQWVSSLRRNDSGKGACELVLVDDISVI